MNDLIPIGGDREHCRWEIRMDMLRANIPAAGLSSVVGSALLFTLVECSLIPKTMHIKLVSVYIMPLCRRIDMKKENGESNKETNSGWNAAQSHQNRKERERDRNRMSSWNWHVQTCYVAISRNAAATEESKEATHTHTHTHTCILSLTLRFLFTHTIVVSSSLFLIYVDVVIFFFGCRHRCCCCSPPHHSTEEEEEEKKMMRWLRIRNAFIWVCHHVMPTPTINK